MTLRCLICNSSVVLLKDTAEALASIAGLLSGFLAGIQQPRPNHPLAAPTATNSAIKAVTLLKNGMAGAISNWENTQSFIQNLRKYQFTSKDCICLGCGAKFDKKDA